MTKDNTPYVEKKEINIKPCQHQFKIISSTEMKCIKCGMGYTGTNIKKLQELYNNNLTT